jgi:hypothetical protein
VSAILCVIAYLLAGVLCLLVLVRTVPDDFNARENIAANAWLVVPAWPIVAPLYWLLSRDWESKQNGLLMRYRAKHRRPNA